MKVDGMVRATDTREYWKRELDTWLLRIATITLKPDNAPIAAKTVYQWLFDETFGGSEQRNVDLMLHFLARDHPRNDVATPAIVASLRSIHEQLAERIAANDPGEDIIEEL